MNRVTRERVEEFRRDSSESAQAIGAYGVFGTRSLGQEDELTIVAICDRLLALEDARWVPWKVGDALPESFDDRQYRTMRRCHGLKFSQDMWPETFERLEVFAYWSVPLPPPYDKAIAALGGGK